MCMYRTFAHISRFSESLTVHNKYTNYSILDAKVHCCWLATHCTIKCTVFCMSLAIGLCMDAGYSTCCSHGYCGGRPATCSCNPDCYLLGDCCADIADICPEGEQRFLQLLSSTVFFFHLIMNKYIFHYS